MRPIILMIIILLASTFANGQTIYLKTFGNSKDKPIIFLHGGPGSNCAGFEVTTAQKLADKGFYVIVYDRRGEGRSQDPDAQYTFKQTFDDLDNIYRENGFSKATLTGHSFGGVIATLFAEKYPEKVQSLILLSVPVSFQETFKTILSNSRISYQNKNDSLNLNYISMLENMDKSSIEYSSYCLMHAMYNGFYSPKNPTNEASMIYSNFKSDSILIKYASAMTYQAPPGFWRNEKYTTIDLTTSLKKLQAHEVNIYGLYGKDDGLFSSDQVKQLQDLLGETNAMYFDDCSHNVFIDQQSKFISAIEEWAK